MFAYVRIIWKKVFGNAPCSEAGAPSEFRRRDPSPRCYDETSASAPKQWAIGPGRGRKLQGEIGPGDTKKINWRRQFELSSSTYLTCLDSRAQRVKRVQSPIGGFPPAGTPRLYGRMPAATLPKRVDPTFLHFCGAKAEQMENAKPVKILAISIISRATPISDKSF